MQIASDAPPRALAFEELLSGSDAEPFVFTNSLTLDGDQVVHGHDFTEIALVTAGTGWHCSVEGETPMRRGEVAVIRPGSWHTYRACEQLRTINCCLRADGLGTFLHWLRAQPSVNWLLVSGPLGAGLRGAVVGRLDEAATRDAETYMHHLNAAVADRGTTSATEASAWLALTLCHLARNAAWPSPVTTAPLPRPVLTTVQVADKRPEHPWTLDSLADAAHCSPSHLTRLCRQHLGLSAMAYLARVRWERAASLLLETSMPVGQVGAAVGWPDGNYFSRVFRAQSGMSPRAYRRNAARMRTRRLEGVAPSVRGER